MTRMLLLAVCLALMLMVLVLVKQRSVPPAITGSRITLEQIKQCAELVTLRVPLQQLVETRIDGYTGGVRCLVLARGEAVIGTDLENARLSYHGGRVTLTLDEPRVIQCTLDQERTSVVFVGRGGLWSAIIWVDLKNAMTPTNYRRLIREAGP